MNVYDFDKTIYNGDSSIDFTLFCFRRHPKLFKYFIIQIKGVSLFLLGKIDKTEMKQLLFSYLNGINDIDQEVQNFWITHKGKIQDWYLEQKKEADLVISASPFFLLEPICKELNIALLASVVDKKTGKFRNKNCFGEEKLKRFKEEYPDAVIDRVYTDSLSDEPIMRYANSAYLVHNGTLSQWI